MKITEYLQELETKALQCEKEKVGLFLPIKSKDLDIEFIIDSREQINSRYVFESYPSAIKALSAGDYSLSGYEYKISIERKSLDDYISTIIHNRDRFIIELNKLQGYENKIIVVEGKFSDILERRYTSKTHPNSIIGLGNSLSFNYDIPIYFLENFEASNRFVEQYLIRFFLRKIRNSSFYVKEQNLNLYINEAVTQLHLCDFIDSVTIHKEVFKQHLTLIKNHPGCCILLECCYTDILFKRYSQNIDINKLEDIIISIIIDWEIPIYFLENKEIANKWLKKYLTRWEQKEEKQLKLF